jgi:hypothetical protein
MRATRKKRPTPRAADLGYAPRYLELLSRLEVCPVSAASPRSHPKRLTPTVRQPVENQNPFLNRRLDL